jgi:hypothetical protein
MLNTVLEYTFSASGSFTIPEILAPEGQEVLTLIEACGGGGGGAGGANSPGNQQGSGGGGGGAGAPISQLTVKIPAGRPIDIQIGEGGPGGGRGQAGQPGAPTRITLPTSANPLEFPGGAPGRTGLAGFPYTGGDGGPALPGAASGGPGGKGQSDAENGAPGESTFRASGGPGGLTNAVRTWGGGGGGGGAAFGAGGAGGGTQFTYVDGRHVPDNLNALPGAGPGAGGGGGGGGDDCPGGLGGDGAPGFVRLTLLGAVSVR